ncbi:MAG: prolyl-tRNA synthetase associated domain-containing protein [Oscillibacter sp.]|nr:prolyl-tRNA synthetase associated domain-containing protein [Oscillibacter sp.]
MNKQETYEYLTEHGVQYEVTEHQAVFNMAELDSVELPYPDRDAKNLFVRDDKKRNFYLITVKGDKRVDLKAFRKAQGLRALSFASAEDLMALMKLVPGAVTPLGLLNDDERRVIFYMDASFRSGLVGVHPNDNTATVWMTAEELARIVREHGNEVRWVEIEG